MFNLRTVAKYAAHLVVSANVNAVVEHQITTRTDHTKDEIAVKVVTGCAGELVANSTDKFTDRAVDNVADRFAARKARKAETTEK